MPFDLIRQMLEDSKAVQAINKMHWALYPLQYSDYPLFTSDRPIVRTSGLGYSESNLVMPIDPKNLFIAAADPSIIAELCKISHNQIAKAMNREVISAAVRVSYSQSNKALAFVQRHMSTKNAPRFYTDILERLGGFPDSAE